MLWLIDSYQCIIRLLHKLSQSVSVNHACTHKWLLQRKSGIAGDWKNFLSPEQLAQIDSICAERLINKGLIRAGAYSHRCMHEAKS